MFNIPVTYPTPDEEVAIVKSTTVVRSAETRPVLDAAEIVRLQRPCARGPRGGRRRALRGGPGDRLSSWAREELDLRFTST